MPKISQVCQTLPFKLARLFNHIFQACQASIIFSEVTKRAQDTASTSARPLM